MFINYSITKSKSKIFLSQNTFFIKFTFIKNLLFLILKIYLALFKSQNQKRKDC